MARKVPPLPMAQPQAADGSAQDHVGPLPPPVSGSSTAGSPREALGAVPRSPMGSTSRSRPSTDEVRMRRRRMDSLNLDQPEGFHYDNVMQSLNFSRYLPEFCSPTLRSPESTVVEGQELYLHFFHEQLRSEGLGDWVAQEEARLSPLHFDGAHLSDSTVDGAVRTRRRTLSMNLENFQNPIWRETGRDLQSLADAFANSVERIQVRERAAQVDIQSINMEKFFSLLTELFLGGRITRERILVLFFFCSDVAILAVRSRAGELLARLTQWSLLFIKDKVCAWVHQHGGWNVVLRSGLNIIQQSAIIGMCAAVITCCFIYIRKNC